jgi:Bacteriophage replication gene A protein (GPA)
VGAAVTPGASSSLTLAQIKRVPAWQRERASLHAHVASLMDGMPARWVSAVSDEWERRRQIDAMASARWGFALMRRLRAGALEGVQIGDNDGDICNRARLCARRIGDMLAAIKARCDKLRPGDTRAHRERMAERLGAWWVRGDFAARGLSDLLPQGPGITRRGMLGRVADEVFWRRALRRAHATLLESAAVDLGMVRAGRGCYVSDESLKRRRGQLARNAAALASTLAVNERGESLTLAEIAARGVADKAVRRAELMTRISGFEVIANDVGHQADFITVTCPSRYHKWRRGETDAKAANPNYQGATPKDAQQYLAKQWQKFRAAAARAGLGLYGFRIAEPHHDGCPHWHMLMWHAGTTAKGKDAGEVLGALLARYFLHNDSPDEKGAAEYRIKVERVDPAKGSAVAYVAKYVAKNIDGYKVERDLYGNPALESSARVEAWAATWGIRQFQQIGGAPVGVWRELRRLHPGNVPAEAGQVLHEMVQMVNASAIDAAMVGTERHNAQAHQMSPKADDSEAQEGQRIRKGWAAYVMAQGGPTAKRKAHVLRVNRTDTGEIGRYGDVKAATVVGIAAQSVTLERFGIVARHRRVRVDLVDSERASWVTAVMGRDPGARARLAERLAAVFENNGQRVALMLREGRRNSHRARRALACQVGEASARGAAVRPWTRVNNCTGVDDPFAPKVIHTPKRGQVFRWNRGRFTEENGHGTESNRPAGPAG